jgi:hypothetical protein
MFYRRLIESSALFAVAALVSGCLNGDSSPAGSSDPATDEEAIEYVMSSEMPEFAEVDVRYYDDGSDAASAPIATERWRRELLSLDRHAEILIDKPDGAPATASVTISGEAIGLLHLWAPGEDPESPPLEVTKDFDDSGSRSLFFEKIRDNRTAHHRGWKLTALSGVEIASDGATRNINSIRVQAGDVDETITGVSELVAVEELLALPAGSEVIVTVDTGDPEDSVFLHVRHLRRRVELDNNEDGTFTGMFHTGFGPNDRPEMSPGNRYRPRHALIDVLSNGTLYDDVAPYDNVAWGIPYLIQDDEVDIASGGE